MLDNQTKEVDIPTLMPDKVDFKARVLPEINI